MSIEGEGARLVTHYVATITSELEAMGVIETVMGPGLSNAERWRIARWVADRWQQPPLSRDGD